MTKKETSLLGYCADGNVSAAALRNVVLSRLMVVSRGAKKKQAYVTNQ